MIAYDTYNEGDTVMTSLSAYTFPATCHIALNGIYGTIQCHIWLNMVTSTGLQI